MNQKKRVSFQVTSFILHIDKAQLNLSKKKIITAWKKCSLIWLHMLVERNAITSHTPNPDFHE